MGRIYNFSAGPATLPLEALEEAQKQLVDYQGAGFSIMEASHRGKEYDAVHSEALANLRELLAIPDTHEVLLLQGGATAQFALIPMNILGADQTAAYTMTGAWAKKAISEAKIVGNVDVVADSTGETPHRMPKLDEVPAADGAAYLHICSNETIGGIQWPEFPEHHTLVADMSSDILSRPIDVSKFGIIYAGAQKNMGPSGLAVVIIRKDLLDRAPATVPGIFRYKTHADGNSMANTPPCFSIYMLSLTTRWLLDNGGVAAMEVVNNRKAGKLYDAIDAGDFYRGTADPGWRSPMNVTFRLPTEALESQFIQEAAAKGFAGLKGHRSVGGVRASIYNAFPEDGVDALIAFMQAFEQANS